MNNDNNARRFQNRTHSLTLALMGDGTYVLSLFALGADGQPDTDNGEVFVKSIEHMPEPASSIQSRAEAAWRDYSGLLRCTADRFDQECSAVYQWASSVISCPSDKENDHKSLRAEMQTLARAMRDLQLATLGRKNPELEARRVRALEHGRTTLANGVIRCV